MDWPDDESGRGPRASLAMLLARRLTAHTSIAAVEDWLARARVARGLRTLSEGRVVVTDRLHGHILSLLLGTPHVLLDSAQGKLRGFYETWTRGSELVQWADSVDEAANLAREGALPWAA
jgi:pyruvyl transferase EpsO